MTTCLSIGEKLNQRLGPEWISDRSGPGGGKLQYIEGHSAINIANEIFGYDGWSSVIKESVVDFVDVSDNGRVSLGISTTVRITIKHSDTVHEDIGYGSVENMKSKADAFEKARKESATDGLKRALRKLGNALGLCLYDKSFTRHIKNMARTQPPFDPKNLYRQEHIRKSLESEQKTAHEISTPSSPSSSSVKKKQQATLPQQQPAPVRTTVPHFSIPSSASLLSSSLSKQPSTPATTSFPSIIPSSRHPPPASAPLSPRYHQSPVYQPHLPAAPDGITMNVLNLKKESLSDNKLSTSRQANSPAAVLNTQDSFGLDEEDEAFYAQMGDVERSAVEQLQVTCGRTSDLPINPTPNYNPIRKRQRQ